MLKRLLVSAIALMTVFTLVAGCSGGGSKQKITVGSKDFTESILLGEMVAQLVEGNTSLTVERKLNLGGTKVNFDGIKAGDLDTYVDYDGTGYSVHLGHTEPITNPDALFDQVKKEFEDKFQLTWSKPFGFNNTYALAIPKTLADQYNVKTYSDLAKVSDKFVFGTTSEFLGRQADGYDPLVKAYGFKFKDVKTMTAGLRYPAIKQNEIQAMDAYATDGKLTEFGMLVLQDDKKFFPPYKAGAVIRMDTVKKHPEVLEAINKLGGMLSDKTMQELNYRVDVKSETVEAVAKDFLKSKGLVK